MKKPLAIDLFCGLGGWTEGLLAEGYRVVGYDVEAHDYGDGKRYPAELVLQDVLKIHGSQFKDAALIVASPPCQEYSYMAMPWSRAKAIEAAICGDGSFPDGYTGSRTVENLNALFDACFRIQREAIEAAGHFIPMVVENVRGAQPWVGKAKWNFGSFYLWGDIPALMPITQPRRKSKPGSWDQTRENYNPDKTWDEGTKLPGNNSPRLWSEVQRLCDAPTEGFKTQGMNWSDKTLRGQDFTRIAGNQADGVKTVAHVNQRDGYGHTRHLTNQCESDAVKFSQSGAAWFDGTPRNANGEQGPSAFSSQSQSRKAASAAIAKVPFALSQWIAKVWKPVTKSHR